jgi:hypothetical protein
MDEPLRSALLALARALRRRRNLAAAARLCPPGRNHGRSGDLAAVAGGVARSAACRSISATLRGYHYHNGVVFAAYCPAFSSAIARGGRYDGVGKAFGRAVQRPVSRWICANWRGWRRSGGARGRSWRPAAAARSGRRDCGCARRARSSSNCCRAKRSSEGPRVTANWSNATGSGLLRQSTGTDHKNG